MLKRMKTYRKEKKKQSHPWVVFSIIAGCYFFVYFHRVSTSVIAPDLLEAFDTNATALGFMSSMYFYFYAFEQPMVGYLSDRLGPRRVVGYWTILAAVATVLFGLAPSVGWASVWRALIGFGVGGVYVPALKAFSQWFKPRDFSTMAGLLMAVGNLGGIVATTPLAWMAGMWGWRSPFFGIGAATLVFGVAVLVGIKDFAPDAASDGNQEGSAEAVTAEKAPSTMRILMSSRFWVLAVIFAGFLGAFLTFQGLWATPYLVSIYDMNPVKASWFNMLIPVGFVVGAPVFGRLADRIFQNKVNLLIMMLAPETVIWVLLTYGWAMIGVPVMALMLFLLGALTGGFTTGLWALVNDTTAREILGSVSGFLNTAPFLGVAAMQVVSGWLLDRSGRMVEGIFPPEAFQAAFLSCLLVMAGCLALCVGFRKQLARRNPGAPF
jgi:sugar phosphate permease